MCSGSSRRNDGRIVIQIRGIGPYFSKATFDSSIISEEDGRLQLFIIESLRPRLTVLVDEYQTVANQGNGFWSPQFQR